MRVFPVPDIVELDAQRCHFRDLIIKLLNLNIDIMEHLTTRVCGLPVASMQLADACFLPSKSAK